MQKTLAFFAVCCILYTLKQQHAVNTMHICTLYKNIATALCAVNAHDDTLLLAMQHAYNYAVAAHDGKHDLYNTDALVDALNDNYEHDSNCSSNADVSMARALVVDAIDALNAESYTYACNLLAKAILQRAYSLDMLYG